MRDSGTTTKQLLEAPENSIYVWVNGKVDYPKRLAAHLGRDDIKIVPPSFIGDQKLRGRNKSNCFGSRRAFNARTIQAVFFICQ